MKTRLSALSLALLPLAAVAGNDPQLTWSANQFTLTIPYIESASGDKAAYSARLTSSGLPAFSLDGASVKSVASQTATATTPTYSISGGALRLTLPWVEYSSGDTTTSYNATLLMNGANSFAVEKASTGPAWSSTGGSCRPVTYDATAQTAFSGALKVELEDISQREGMLHVRLSNVSATTLFFTLDVSSNDGRVGLMAPQPGTVHLSPGESLIGYVLYYGTGATGAASYKTKFTFTAYDSATGKPTGGSDSFERTVNFTRPVETPLTVSDAATQLNYTRVAQATAQVGFWRYKVDDAETRIVLFPGQENWTNPDAAASAKVLAYTLDGQLLWEYAPGGEVWGGDATNDGKYVAFATASAAGAKPSRLILLDATSGKLIKELELNIAGLPAPANAVAPITNGADSREVRFSPDGSLIAVGTSEGRGYLFARDGLTAKYAVQTEGQLRAIEFKGDHLYLGSGDGLVHKIKTGDASPVWKGYTTAWPYSEPAFSPDGKRLAVGAKSGGFTVLDADSGACVFSANYGTVRRAFFTPDGQHLIAATGATAAGTIAYRVADWSVAWRAPMSAAASATADSRYVMMADGKAWIMDRDAGKRVATLDPGFAANANYFKTAYLSKDGSRAVVARRDLTPGDVAIAFFKRQ